MYQFTVLIFLIRSKICHFGRKSNAVQHLSEFPSEVQADQGGAVSHWRPHYEAGAWDLCGTAASQTIGPHKTLSLCWTRELLTEECLLSHDINAICDSSLLYYDDLIRNLCDVHWNFSIKDWYKMVLITTHFETYWSPIVKMMYAVSWDVLCILYQVWYSASTIKFECTYLIDFFKWVMFIFLPFLLF